MKNLTKICLLILLTVCTAAVAQTATPARTQAPINNVSAPNKTIMVSQQTPEFSITLYANPTTGYSWFAKKYDSSLITVVKHVYHPPISQLAGAGGKDVWTFQLKPAAFAAPHVLQVTMLYARPWAIQEGGKEVNFTVTTSN